MIIIEAQTLPSLLSHEEELISWLSYECSCQLAYLKLMNQNAGIN